MKKNWLCGVCLALIVLSGCGGTGVAKKESPSTESTQPESKETESVPAAIENADVNSDETDSDELIVIDVRTPEEYESGHLDGTINIPHTDIVQRIKEVTDDKSAEIYFH